jgi:hypothetical protein
MTSFLGRAIQAPICRPAPVFFRTVGIPRPLAPRCDRHPLTTLAIVDHVAAVTFRSPVLPGPVHVSLDRWPRVCWLAMPLRRRKVPSDSGFYGKWDATSTTVTLLRAGSLGRQSPPESRHDSGARGPLLRLVVPAVFARTFFGTELNPTLPIFDRCE